MAQQPVKKFSAGQVSCAVWENNANVNGWTVAMLKATVERRYKDRDDTWKSSGSFSRNEIPLAIWCLEQAFTSMIESGKEEDQRQVVEEEVIE